jgi:prepilin-type N-terminal cleavage/methylation domain-containing protein
MFGRVRKDAEGFSLIELLIVMAIIAILAAIAIPNLLTAQKKAKISKALAETKLIVTQTQMYQADKNAYPGVINDLRLNNYISRTEDPFTTVTGNNYGYAAAAAHIWALSVGPDAAAPGTIVAAWPGAALEDGISSATCGVPGGDGYIGWSSNYGAITVTGC